ncbi:MAG: hypothetical protein WAU70_18075 [Flavobacteriales bacterium]
MTRSLLAPFCFIGTAAFAQVPMEDFESAGTFDLSNVQSYCMLGMMQGSSDTYGASSAWSVEFPYAFQGTCPFLTPGIFVPLTGVGPGDQFAVHHWQKLQSTGTAVLTMLMYVYPATGVLPADPMDLQYASSGTYWGTSAGTWLPVTDNFDLPAAMPWPSDVYLMIHVPTDSMFMSSTLVDDVSLTPPLNAGVATHTQQGREIRISPQPAVDRIVVSGLTNDPVAIFNSAGACLTSSVAPVDGAVWNVQHLPAGLYVLRQGERCARFIKG